MLSVETIYRLAGLMLGAASVCNLLDRSGRNRFKKAIFWGAFAAERGDMSDTDWTMDSGEEDIDEQGRNPTQQRLDEESSPPEVENEPSPHQGEEGTEPV